jgi:hypothetical protein
VTVLAGPFAIITVVLALGGALKTIDPVPTSNALRSLRVPLAPGLVRVGGAFELIVAVAALVTGEAAPAVVVALSYAAFAAVVVLALVAHRPISSCGCFGKVDTPPSWIHVAIDIAAAGVAAAAAFAETTEIALPDVLAKQPLAGVPFVLLVANGVVFVFLAFTALPKTIAAASAVRRSSTRASA